jgi:hypothetical protein
MGSSARLRVDRSWLCQLCLDAIDPEFGSRQFSPAMTGWHYAQAFKNGNTSLAIWK